MQNKLSKNSDKKGNLDSESLQQGFDRSRKSEIIKREEERVEVEFRHIARIYARDFEAIMKSFEEWASKWN
jgi:hypothetical protein